ncbi:MAG: hypothetical protein MMC33_003993 [Icmadophila ericetorum]|nr:hypothetical protein [Icmadophila ericetorum]
MKLPIVPTILLPLFGLVYASPVPEGALEARQNVFDALVICYGAAGAQVTFEIPADNQPHAITESLSCSMLCLEGGATCLVTGIDGSETELIGAMCADVGPPQVQVSGSCLAF